MPSKPLSVALDSKNPQETRYFSADSSQTILQAAEKADIYLPSSCRNGTCRTCVSTLLSGTVTYKIDWPGLSAEEKQTGLILPCCAYPQTDLVMRFGY
jgi:ferredoxin